MPEEKSEQMTRAQKAQLEAELAELEGPRRKDVVAAIAAARAFGDLSENFEYHAAKNEQGLLERRIAILRDRLDHAEIVEAGGPPRAAPGPRGGGAGEGRGGGAGGRSGPPGARPPPPPPPPPGAPPPPRAP